MDHSLSYLIIGTGGTGGPLGCYLAKAGFPVTFIARGKQLAAMQKNGLRCERPQDAFTINPMQACDMDTYAEAVRRGEVKRPDVIFVCVKGYSIDKSDGTMGDGPGEIRDLIYPFWSYGTSLHFAVCLNSFSKGGETFLFYRDVTPQEDASESSKSYQIHWEEL